jgi:3-methyladenine DNA glycosylase AlkC
MAAPLKAFFSPALVRRLAADLTRAESSFPSAQFVRQATRGLEQLELLDRGKHIARALHQHLPADYPSALRVLMRSLGPEHASEELVGAGMAPFYYLPHTVFVAEHGLEHFDLSLRAQYELTKRFTAEFSIRAFLAADPERTLSKLAAWAQDPHPHVRRLVSEGTRLRLPWAPRVGWLDAHPERVLALIEPLKADPAALVRRSVANSLNDLSKVYPELAVTTCRAWSRSASDPTRALIRHALRSLVKRGDRAALALLGVGKRAEVTLQSARLSAKSVRMGDGLRFSFELVNTAARTQDLLVDFVVHFVKANGSLRPKVFKLKRVTLSAGASVVLRGRVSLASMTTRRHYPGQHLIEVLINGEPRPLGAFEVRA